MVWAEVTLAVITLWNADQQLPVCAGDRTEIGDDLLPVFALVGLRTLVVCQYILVGFLHFRRSGIVRNVLPDPVRIRRGIIITLS